jgi:hypothetical protein
MEDRLHDAPALLGLVAPDREHRITLDGVDEQPGVWRQLLRREGQLERSFLEAEGVAGAVEGEVERHPVRAHLEHEPIDRRLALLAEDKIGYGSEPDRDLSAVGGQGLAGSEAERDTPPAVVVDEQRDLRQCLGLAGGSTPGSRV